MWDRLFPRLSISSSKPIIWFHCASVGEFNTAKPILSELKKDFFILLTYFSPRAKNFLQSQKDFYHALHPLPLDLPFSVESFLKRVNPFALMVMERELWYFMLKKTKAKKILLNTYAKGSLMERLLSKEFDLIICRTEKDKEIFHSFSAKAVACGNLKFVMEREDKDIELSMPEGKVIVAGSFHPSELGVLKGFYRELLKKVKGINLVVVPRHVSKVEVFMKELAEFKPCLKSSKVPDCRFVVVDTLGELFYLYKLSHISLVGGTFSKGVGGHNILEPVYHKKFVLFGEHAQKIKDLEEFVLSKGLGFKVKSVREAVDVAMKVINGEIVYPEFDLREYAKKIKECYMDWISKTLEV
ncbi:3-deoxy-D-manno-octulosonic acid transferase [Thermocrinis sp.]